MTEPQIPPVTLKSRRRGILVQLPVSQEWVRVRPVDLSLVIKLGRIPDSMLNAVVRTFEGEVKQVVREHESRLHAIFQESNDLRAQYEAYAMAMLVEPRMVDDPQTDDEIGPNELLMGDLEFLHGLAFQSALELERFSVEQIRRIPAVSDQPDNEPATERPAESQAGDRAEMGRDTGSVGATPV